MIQLDITRIESDAAKDPSVIGTVFGDVGTDSFKFSLTGRAERSDYVVADHPDCGPVLCQIDSIIRKTNYTLDRSLERDSGCTVEEKVIASVSVIGYRNNNGLLVTPRTPFEVGIDVRIPHVRGPACRGHERIRSSQ